MKRAKESKPPPGARRSEPEKAAKARGPKALLRQLVQRLCAYPSDD